MKHFNVFIAVLILTCFALAPAAVRADDELEDFDVMMQVLDDDVDIGDDVAAMRGPERDEAG
ncbi:MAG: hypothetical protein KAJ57_00615, partial [Woeseiaceae bacterium]|nr:hypothetical protein [Woeseiaceae bacterium]